MLMYCVLLTYDDKWRLIGNVMLLLWYPILAVRYLLRFFWKCSNFYVFVMEDADADCISLHLRSIKMHLDICMDICCFYCHPFYSSRAIFSFQPCLRKATISHNANGLEAFRSIIICLTCNQRACVRERQT